MLVGELCAQPDHQFSRECILREFSLTIVLAFFASTQVFHQATKAEISDHRNEKNFYCYL